MAAPKFIYVNLLSEEPCTLPCPHHVTHTMGDKFPDGSIEGFQHVNPSLLDTSDGDEGTWPADHEDASTEQLEKFLGLLTEAMMENNIFKAIGSLPKGYKLFYRRRKTTNSREADPLLYGHPKGLFSSAKAFQPHLMAMLEDRVDECECVVCQKPIGRRPAKKT